jgi:hypothetical protein
MTQAILVTLFCCLPLGVAAIFQARAVDKALAAGGRTRGRFAGHRDFVIGNLSSTHP